MRKDGFLVASVAAVLSFGFVGVGLGSLFASADSRLVLTVSETFGGLADIRDLLKNTSSFLAGANPLSITHVRYPVGVQTLEELEDLERRGLIGGAALASFNRSAVESPSLLERLMRMSWCSSGLGSPGSFPAYRTPGCRCIADAYLALVNETTPVNATILTVVNVSKEVGERIGNRVYRCWDQRQVTRSKMCGKLCTTHVASLGVFANAIMFLLCAAFILSIKLHWGRMTQKLVILFLGLAFASVFLVRDAEANTLNLVGLAICILLLIWSLDDELNPGNKTGGPHPLMVCILVNLPLILSAHTYQISVSGFGRDLWVVTSFGVCGGMLGVILQRYFWMSCYSASDGKGFVARSALIAGFLTTLILLLLLFSAYRYDGSPYVGGSVLVFTMYFLFLLVLMWLLNEDFFQRHVVQRGANELSGVEVGIMCMVVGANAFMTIVGVADVGNHPRKNL